ncbi:MAG: hypothetical protein A3A86_05210 [Elusimicrobia bacterium RIFCSPLOWO2_01_FULL_60_11]|nr:MAG: hypothetical protein A3A86_05210 [Elusimicrobia bacterium RIFCSPLOWO2_01_FULL_60_11]
MNLETRVGLFVLIGLLVFGFGIMRLSDITFKKSYKLHFIFDDIGNLKDKSAIKMSGVEIGKIRGIKLENGKAKVTAYINADVPVYANARVKVQATGIVGTQYLGLTPGTPEAPRLKDGDTLYGESKQTLDTLVEKISDILGGKDGKSGIGDDLKATIANLRSVTDSLNHAIGKQRDELKDMVSNFHQFSADLKGIASDVHEVTTARKADIDASIARLKSILERVDDIVAKIHRGEGSIGKLVSDKEMGEDVKQTVASLKETAQSARDVLGRFTRVRSFWELQVRSVPAINGYRADGGVRLQFRDDKYYYLGVSNAGDRKYEFKEPEDYEKKSTLTAVIGKKYGPATLEVGAIRSSVGVGLKVYPFMPWADEKSPARWARGFEVNAQAFDFGRDEIRGRAGRERLFSRPQYNIGAAYQVNRFVALGATVEDLAEVKQYSMKTHVTFEDKDLSYLFGFVSVAR